MNLVDNSSQKAVFDALYSLEAGDGRSEAPSVDSFGIARVPTSARS